MGAGAVTWYRIYSLEQLGFLFFFLLRGPSNNNRIQAYSGLILNSYEEILGRKEVRKRGASGAVSRAFAFAHTLIFLLL